MKSVRLIAAFCVAFLAAGGFAFAEAQRSGQSYALLVGGLPGKEPYSHWYEDWLGRFQTYLIKEAGTPAGNVSVLSGTSATSAAITGALAELSQRIKPEDQFILMIVGHGEINEPEPTLILPGPDLSASRLASGLKGIASRNQVILNFSASSGAFLKSLVSPVRVNITATSPNELREPVFAEFFLRGLESRRAASDQNSPITLLNAYNWAAKQTAFWIARWQQTGGQETNSKMWKASGKETVEIFEKLYRNAPSRRLDPSSARNAPDVEVALAPAGGQVTPEWVGRRIVEEHAMLEDCGRETGISALGENGIQLISGEKPNDPGYLAAHVILGKPSLP